MKIIVILISFIFALLPALRAELKLPGAFTDHMVLQQQQSNLLWGWDVPGNKISINFSGHDYATTTGSDGRWEAKLDPAPASTTPQTLTVTGSTKREIHDVLIGEVWLCSGQSNMEMGIGLVQDAAKEIAAADFPGIRLLKVPKAWLPQPQMDQAGNWDVCTPETIAKAGRNGFSAAAYFFGRELHRTLNVPIGLIDATWGGTRIESWTPPEGFAAVPALSSFSAALGSADPHSASHRQILGQYLAELDQWMASARIALTNSTPAPAMRNYPDELLPPHDLQDPTALYNGMIHPVQFFKIRGAIWYQGEANLGEGLLYSEKMKALVGGWRQIWNEGDFPFYFVQIAPFIYDTSPDELPELWEAQALVGLGIPKAGMTVINDIGNLNEIHPANKQEVGRRLALLALTRTYGRDHLSDSGPVFKSMEIEGRTLRIRFDHTDGGLVCRDGQPPDWFEIMDADTGGFVKAQARIDGATVVLSSRETVHPVAMRFAWNQRATPNLMNGAGLPAGAFRAGTVPKRN